jgi:hypothetical protein
MKNAYGCSYSAMEQGDGQKLGQLVVPQTYVNSSNAAAMDVIRMMDVLGAQSLPILYLGSLQPFKGPTGQALVNFSLSLAATLAIESTAGQFGDFILTFLNNDTVQVRHTKQSFYCALI